MPGRPALQSLQPYIRLRRVAIEDNVFIGHGVTFINDSYRAQLRRRANCKPKSDWHVEATVNQAWGVHGSGAQFLSKVIVGENPSWEPERVTRDVPPNVIVAGIPQKFLRPYHRKRGPRNDRWDRPYSPLSISLHAHVELQDELVPAFTTAIRSAAFMGGPPSRDLNVNSLVVCDAKHCVGVQQRHGRLAFLALIGRGGPAGDIVSTVPHTFIATTEAISQSGAFPDFVDVDAKTLRWIRRFLPPVMRPVRTRTRTGRLSTARWANPSRGQSCSSLWADCGYGSIL